MARPSPVLNQGYLLLAKSGVQGYLAEQTAETANERVVCSEQGLVPAPFFFFSAAWRRQKGEVNGPGFKHVPIAPELVCLYNA